VSEPFDLVITVCDDANGACPHFPNAKERRHWSIADPAKVQGPRRLDAFRAARDELRQRIEREVLTA
jgi:arsenate reductase